MPAPVPVLEPCSHTAAGGALPVASHAAVSGAAVAANLPCFKCGCGRRGRGGELLWAPGSLILWCPQCRTRSWSWT